MGKVTVINVAVLLLCSVGLVSEAAPDCSGPILTLVQCYPFLTGNATSPPQTCCTPLASVAASQPVCLCEVIGYGNVTLPFQLNLTRALELPSLCSVSATPSECAALFSGSPAGAPSATSPISGVPGGPPQSGASGKIPGTILSIVQYAAVPAVASLLLRFYY